MFVIYIAFGILALLMILGIVFSVDNFIKSKKYLPLKSTEVTDKQKKFLIAKTGLLIKHLKEQYSSLLPRINDLKLKGYTERESIDMLGINNVKSALECLLEFRSKIVSGKKLTQQDIDNFNNIVISSKLTIKIIDWVGLIPRKKIKS